VAALLSACAPLPVAIPAPDTLVQTWMFGLERMRDDPLLLAPYTNRFLAGLAAQPKVRVVFVGGELNQFLFTALPAPKLRVMSWLRGQGSCMEITYTITQAGQQMATFGLVVPPLPAGPEPDSACVDRAATEFYRALVLQGL
jgi:hypothetical protein